MAPSKRQKVQEPKADKRHTVNKLLLHHFICSSFPATFFKGMFSYSACDDWHWRTVHGRQYKKASNHAERLTEKMKCQQTKRGRKLIQVRVLIGDTTVNANGVSVMDTNAVGTGTSTSTTSATCIDKNDCSKTAAKSAAKALRKLVENKKKDAVAAQL
jgi:hypothetical protein